MPTLRRCEVAWVLTNLFTTYLALVYRHVVLWESLISGFLLIGLQKIAHLTRLVQWIAITAYIFTTMRHTHCRWCVRGNVRASMHVYLIVRACGLTWVRACVRACVTSCVQWNMSGYLDLWKAIRKFQHNDCSIYTYYCTPVRIKNDSVLEVWKCDAAGLHCSRTLSWPWFDPSPSGNCAITQRTYLRRQCDSTCTGSSNQVSLWCGDIRAGG